MSRQTYMTFRTRHAIKNPFKSLFMLLPLFAGKLLELECCGDFEKLAEPKHSAAEFYFFGSDICKSGIFEETWEFATTVRSPPL